MNKKILFLCTANPLGVGGGEFATRSYLKAVCDIADGNVDLLVTEEWKDNFVKEFGLQNVYRVVNRSRMQVVTQYFSFIIDRFSKKAMQIVDEHPNEYACVVANGSIISGTIAKYIKSKGIPIVAIYHNYEPEYYKDNFRGLQKMAFLPAVKILEKRAYRNSSCNLFLSSQDMKRFEIEYGKTKAKNSLIGVFEFEEIQPTINSSRKKDTINFVITGSLNIVQGVDGLCYFFDELYKELPENAQIIVAGKNPTETVQKECSQYSNVKLVPNPKNIYEIIEEGDVYICPTRLGGGVKLRVMDGLRLGLPIITHECSARGYDLFWDFPAFEIFSNTKEFAVSVKRIIDLFNKNKIDKTAVYNQYKKTFSYEAGVNRMREAVSEFFFNQNTMK